VNNNINGFGAGDLRALDLLRQNDAAQLPAEQSNTETIEQSKQSNELDLSQLDQGEQILQNQLEQPMMWLEPGRSVPAEVTETPDLVDAVDAGLAFILGGG